MKEENEDVVYDTSLLENLSSAADEKSEKQKSLKEKSSVNRHQAERQISEASDTSADLKSPPMSARLKKKQQDQRHPLPGQSQYKVPGYKQTSRACEIQ